MLRIINNGNSEFDSELFATVEECEREGAYLEYKGKIRDFTCIPGRWQYYTLYVNRGDQTLPENYYSTVEACQAAGAGNGNAFRLPLVVGSMREFVRRCSTPT